MNIEKWIAYLGFVIVVIAINKYKKIYYISFAILNCETMKNFVLRSWKIVKSVNNKSNQKIHRLILNNVKKTLISVVIVRMFNQSEN